MVRKIQKQARAIHRQLCEIPEINQDYQRHRDQHPNVIQIKNAFPKEAYHRWVTVHTVALLRAMYAPTIKPLLI